MPNKVKERWVERQIARGHHKYVPTPVVVEVEEVVEPVIEEVVEPVVEEVEPTVVESGTVTGVEVVEEEPVTKKKTTKKTV